MKNLFTLVKSLTMSEIRHFKIYSKRHILGNENKYIQLFDCIKRNELSEDAELKKLLASLNFNTSYLAADKNYLYNIILHSLSEFHKAKSTSMLLKEGLNDIEILFNKGMYEDVLTVINHYEKLATKNENFVLLLEILNWKKKCVGYSSGIVKAKQINEQIERIIEKIDNLKDIMHLYYESYIFRFNDDKSKSKDVLNSFKKLIQQPLLKSNKNALSLTGKIYFDLTYAHYYFVINDTKNEYLILKDLIAEIEKNEWYILEFPLDYLSIYRKYLPLLTTKNTNILFESFDKMLSYSNKLTFQKNVFENRVKIMSVQYSIEYYLNKNENNTSIDIIKNFEKVLKKQQSLFEPFYLIEFYYQCAVTYFNANKFKSALDYTNKIIHEYTRETAPMLLLRTKLLNAHIHYKLNNIDFIYNNRHTILKDKNFENLSNNEQKLFKTIIKRPLKQ